MFDHRACKKKKRFFARFDKNIQADAGEQERDRDSAQRLFMGWMQKRQRECVTIISLGCVTVTFAGTVIAGVSGTFDVAVVLIPVTVHLLLVRDIWIKWGERHASKKSNP